MPIENPYRQHANWYRGNTHAHSTRSDGRSDVPEVLAFYRNAGYDFLCLTDHDVHAEVAAQSDERFLAIDSEEVTVRGRYHICSLGTDALVAKSQPPQATVDGIAAQRGLAVLAHPLWSGLDVADAAALRGLTGVEIFNAVCQYLEYNGWALAYWDALLRRGLRVWGVASDDMHDLRYHGAQGWVHVNAPELSRDAIMANLAAGNFYASTGAQFHEIAVDGDRIRVVSSPAAALRVRNGNNRAAQVKHAEHHSTIEYQVQGDEGYVRFDLVGTDGRSAWTNPFFIA